MKVAKVAQQPQKRIQSDLSYNLRVESYDFWCRRGHSCSKCAKRLGTREAGVPSMVKVPLNVIIVNFKIYFIRNIFWKFYEMKSESKMQILGLSGMYFDANHILN